MKLHLLTLKFSGDLSKLEAPFLSDYYRVSLLHIRISLVLGALLYAAFGILDALLMPEQKNTIWFIRFVVVCPAICVTFLASFSKSFERYMQPLLAGVFILAGVGVIGIIAIAPPPVNYFHYAGLLLVLLWGYTFMRILFIWASLAGWVLVILYEIAAIWIAPTPFAVMLNNNFFFISANIIGMLVCYSIEFYARRDFFLRQQLEIEREKVNKVNQELEERVEKRTADYQIINWRLEQEITSHKQAEEELRKSEHRYRLLIENANEAILVIQDGVIKFVNSRASESFGYSEQILLSTPIFELIHPEDRDAVMDRYLQKINGDATSTRHTYRTIHKSGQVSWIEISSVLIEWEGRPATLNLITDITDRKHAEDALSDSEKRYRDLSIVDDLTQLYNSRHFYVQLKIELDRANRYEQPLTLLLLDLDNFKAFNDTYGHVEGDQALQRLGQVVKRCLREADFAYRYGGEEFTILLPMTTSAEGAFTAERIRTELKKENFSPVPDQDVSLTLSIGLAQYKPQEDMKAFVHRVDQLMYQAKKNGKDSVCSEPRR